MSSVKPPSDVLERADEDLPGGKEQEEERVEEERDGAEPRERETPAGFRRPEDSSCATVVASGYAPTFFGHSAAISARGRALLRGLANFTFA